METQHAKNSDTEEKNTLKNNFHFFVETADIIEIHKGLWRLLLYIIKIYRRNGQIFNHIPYQD